MKKVLLVFKHGLGDNVQFVIVLKHIKKYRPDWIVDVFASRGMNKCFNGFCNNVLTVGEDSVNESDYDEVIDFRWWEASMRTSEMCITFQTPPTKVLKSLVELLNINPDPELFKYEIKINTHNRILAKQYLKKIPYKKYVGVHYNGKTSTHKKDISEDLVKEIAEMLSDIGFAMIVFDWDGKTSLPNRESIFRAGKADPIWEGSSYGSSATLAALIDEMDLFIGIDSGPLHVAGATTTPTLGIWTEHHPIHFFDFSDVLHIVPMDSKKYINHNKSCVRNEVELFFRKHYDCRYYNSIKEGTFEGIYKQLGMSENDFCKSIVRDDKWLELRPKQDLIEEFKKWNKEFQQPKVHYRH